jgi:hypothetical protein
MSAQEEIRLDVSAADQVAGTYNVSNFRYHIFPVGTAAGKAAMAARNFGTPITGHDQAITASISSVPVPGFYGEDLVFFGGARLATTKSIRSM